MFISAGVITLVLSDVQLSVNDARICVKKVRKRGKVKRKVKVKFSLEQAMKAQRGSRGIALLFL